MPLHEDMLREILLRLPPRPSSLLRASAVCKHWRGLVTASVFFGQSVAQLPPYLPVNYLFECTMTFKITIGNTICYCPTTETKP
jgi:hypothetical protein